MAFRFPLQALWRVRAIYERREAQRLAVLANQLASAQRELAALKQEQLKEADCLAKNLERGMRSGELQFQVACSSRLESRIDVVSKLIENMRQRRQQQLMLYRHARQKLEVVARLYDRQLSAYRRETERREQQQATELFLIRSLTVGDGQ